MKWSSVLREMHLPWNLLSSTTNLLSAFLNPNSSVSLSMMTLRGDDHIKYIFKRRAAENISYTLAKELALVLEN